MTAPEIIAGLKAQGMARDEIAEAIGASPSSVTGWSTGRRLPPPEAFRKLERLARRYRLTEPVS